MTAPDAETPIDRAFNATDLPHGEFRAFKAGWEAMAVTVVPVARMVAEFNEHANASGIAHTARLCPTLLREEHGELQEALDLHDHSFMDGSDRTERAVARELADVVYVAYTTAWAIGIDLDAALREIHRAAMDKVKANVRRPSDGKIVKPPGFVPPDMTEAVRGGTQ